MVHRGTIIRPRHPRSPRRWGQTYNYGQAGGVRSNGPIPIGRTLDNKYQVQAVLGRGCTGIVYLADDLALQRRVAIKVLFPEYAADPKVAKSFRREAVAMASVRHENTVQIYAFGAHRGLPYFVMEYLAGRTVQTLVDRAGKRREPLHLVLVLNVIHQVCRGLQAVHDRGFVHNDVKPANMLIGPPFRVALGDFGLVQSGGAPPQGLSGTPLYIAPELIRRDRLPDDQRHLSDIYSLGVSAYEMLTGSGPFEGETINELLLSHLHAQPCRISEIRPEVPRALDAVILRALAKAPTERYNNCLELLAAMLQAMRRE
jgi:serine/threonine-protein kinase